MSIATLSIDLEARLSRLETGLAQAQLKTDKAMKSMSSSVLAFQDVTAKVGAAVGGLLGIEAVRRLAVAFTDVVDNFDALNDAADATGSSIEKLSALEDIGRRTGANFDTVSSILVKFNDQLKAASDPGSAAARALAAIGLSADELRRADPAEALQATARAMSGFADDGEKARLVQELFGKSVKEAAPFLRDLAEAGGLVGTVTREQAEQAERFNKSLATMRANVEDLGRTLVSALLPSINEVFEAGRDLDKLFDGFLDAPWLRGGLRTGGGLLLGGDFKKGADETVAAIAEIEANLTRLERASGGRFSVDTSREQARLRARLEEERTLLKFFQRRLATGEGAADYSNEGRNHQRQRRVGSTNENKRSERELRAGRSYRVQTDSVREDRISDRLLQDMERQADAMQRLDEQLFYSARQLNIGMIKDDRERGLAQIDMERNVWAARIREQEIFNGRNQELWDRLDAYVLASQRSLNEQLKPEWERMLEAWSDTSAHMAKSWDALMGGVVNHAEDALTRFVRTGKLSVDDLAEYVQQAIARMLAQKAVTELVNLGTFMFGANPFGHAAKGKAFGSGGAEVNAFASGGVVSSPTYFRYDGGRRNGLMGEAGPEAILPLKRTAGGKLGVQASGQGSGPIVNVYLPMGVTRAELAAFVPTLKEQIAGELVQRMRRPGFAGG